MGIVVSTVLTASTGAEILAQAAHAKVVQRDPVNVERQARR